MTASETTNVEKLGEVLRLAAAKLPKPVRMRAQSSLEGFGRALALFEVDRVMSSSRATTAEEDASAPVFLALQIRRYPGSDLLDLKRHDHKAALRPVLAAARMAIGEGFRDLEF